MKLYFIFILSLIHLCFTDVNLQKKSSVEYYNLLGEWERLPYNNEGNKMPQRCPETHRDVYDIKKEGEKYLVYNYSIPLINRGLHSRGSKTNFSLLYKIDIIKKSHTGKYQVVLTDRYGQYEGMIEQLGLREIKITKILYDEDSRMSKNVTYLKKIK